MQILVSFFNPHKAVSCSIVSKWLKQALEISGINTEIFKGHSTHVASSTKTTLCRVYVSDILKYGNWLNAYTFQKFCRNKFCRISKWVS